MVPFSRDYGGVSCPGVSRRVGWCYIYRGDVTRTLYYPVAPTRMLNRIQFTLIHTSHPGNIGGVARAMKCMGLSSLSLLSPRSFPDDAATSRASGAQDLLDTAVVSDDLGELIGDCVLVVGTTSRHREIPLPVLDPRCAAARISEQARSGKVAVLFGRESSGLTNAEVDACNLLIQIPTGPDYFSLNLASAAQIVAYEIHLAMGPAATTALTTPALADRASLEMLYEHLRQTLVDIEFSQGADNDKLLRKLTRMFNRARLTKEETSILRGILTAAQTRGGSKRGSV